jgi:hypothetical protein
MCSVKLAGAIVASLGGARAIIFGLSGFLGKLWTNRGLEDHRYKYDQLGLQTQHDLDIASRRLQIKLDALGLVHSLRAQEAFFRLADLWIGLVSIERRFSLLLCEPGQF